MLQLCPLQRLLLLLSGSVKRQDLLGDALALLASAPAAVAGASLPAVLLSLWQRVTDAEADLAAAHHYAAAAGLVGQMMMLQLTEKSHFVLRYFVAQRKAPERVVVLTAMPLMAAAAAAALADLATAAHEAVDVTATAAGPVAESVEDAETVLVNVLGAVRMTMTELMALDETVAMSVTAVMAVTVIKTVAAPGCGTVTLAGHERAYASLAFQPTAPQLEALPEGALLLVRPAVRACVAALQLLAVAVVLKQLPWLLLGWRGWGWSQQRLEFERWHPIPGQLQQP